MPQNNEEDSLKHEKPDAIILSGGMLGRRALFPKALLEHDGKTIIEHQIENLSPHVGKIVIACKKGECDMIKKFLGEMVDVDYSEDNSPPLGTAGAVKKAMEKVSTDTVLVTNVNTIADVDLGALFNFGPDTMCVANPRLDFNVVKMEKTDISEYREKPVVNQLWVNCGIYYLSRKSIEDHLPTVGSLERDAFPFMKLKAFRHAGVFKHL
jgi:NDP-sugar pyrophosphorylase family protein